MAAGTGTLISIKDLENAISPQTVTQLFNDSRDGLADPDAVQSVIDRAEADVYAYLMRAFPAITAPFTFSETGRALLKDAALCFAIPYSFLRHPEYVRTFGENPRGQSMLEQAHAKMERLCTGKQVLFGVDVGGAVPVSSATGCAVYDTGPRTMTDSIDGTYNGGDL